LKLPVNADVTSQLKWITINPLRFLGLLECQYVYEVVIRLPYWTRVWVVQEVMYTLAAVVAYGYRTLSFHRFRNFQQLILESVFHESKARCHSTETDLPLNFPPGTARNGTFLGSGASVSILALGITGTRRHSKAQAVFYLDLLLLASTVQHNLR